MIIREIAERLQPRVEDLCRELLPNGKLRGHEWVCGDITGAPGDSLAVELRGDKAGVWYDHATNEGGDVIDLIQATRQLQNAGYASVWGAKWLGIPDSQLNGTNGHAVTADVFDPLKFRHKRDQDTDWRTGTAAWEYRDASGAIIGWVVRFDDPPTPEHPGGGKRILPIRLIDGKPHWKGWKKPELRPIYGIHRLSSAPPDAPLLIVEGEKTADAARKLFPNDVVLTPMGGTGSFSSSADWGPVIQASASRTVRLWPDADKAGRSAMTYLKARIPQALVVDTSGLPDGWDLADPVPPDVSIQGLYDAAGATPAPQPPRPATTAPYRVLGIADSELFFHSYRSGDIVTFTPAAMTELNLQLLAPDDYWKSKGYTTLDEQSVDYRIVAKSLIDEAHVAGRFSPDLIRGRGCWIDPHPVTRQPRVVFNAGDRLYVDGVLTAGQPDSRYSYRSGVAIPFDPSTQASDDDGRMLARICDLLPYSDTTLKWILPAILFLGPICGALDYRPGVWIDGEQGSGKSTLYLEYFGRLWERCCFEFKGATSEAGIRQKIGSDALPVTFDEAEARTTRAAARLDAVLELIRQSSTETGGQIVKGSASGSSVSFEVRSMFALFSIAAPAMETADESRLARVTLTKDHNTAKYDELLRLLSKLDEAFCMRLRARAVNSVLRIREAYGIFRKLIATHSRSSRKGQQFGMLAAGVWCLENSNMPTTAMATCFVKNQPWATLGAGTDDNSDQQLCLAHLLQHRTHWQDAEARRHDESVDGLIQLWRMAGPERGAAQHALNLIGLNISTSGLYVSNKHPGLSGVFRNTQFDGRWKDYLKRLTGAVDISVKLAGSRTWCVRVPVGGEELPL